MFDRKVLKLERYSSNTLHVSLHSTLYTLHSTMIYSSAALEEKEQASQAVCVFGDSADTS